MADMPTNFWAGWIVTITVFSLLGLLWLIFSIYFSAKGSEETKSPIWDSTLREGSHPAPMWWFWMILLAMVISVIYLMLYPGLGSFSGVLKWSQGGRLDQSLTRYDEKFAQMRHNIVQLPISELQNDPAIMSSARRIFAQNCAACHGPNGEGQAFAFPNLRDDDWQWGGSETEIAQTIKLGRRAAMIGWQNIIGKEGVSQAINYVRSLSPNVVSASNSQGEKLYQQNCVACHGMAGEGNAVIGAPKLADDIWLYGNSEAALRHTIAVGRNGVMPAFDNRLDATQIRMLVAWLYSDGNSAIVASNIKEKAEVNEKVVSDGAALGEQVYGNYCASCHQRNGEGLPGVFPPLAGSEAVLNEDASEHIDIVLNGLKDKVIAGVNYPSPMPGFGAQLNDDEVAAVINHERAQWDNSAVQITSNEVASKR